MARGTGHGSRITLVYGTEDHLRREEIGRLRDAWVKPEARPFDEARFSAGEDSLERAGEELKTRAVLSRGRLVWVSQCERLRARDTAWLKEQLAAGAPANHLLLEAGDVRADHPVLRLARENGKAIRCAPLSGQPLANWVRGRFQREGVELEPDVPSFLIDRLAGSMTELAKAVERIALSRRGPERVGVEAARRLVPMDRSGAFFELTDAFGRKDAAAALGHVHEMLRMGKRIPEIIGLLFWQLKQLGTVLELARHKTPVAEVARVLRRHPFYAEKLVRQAGGFTEPEIARDLDLIVQTDLQTKNSGMKDRVALEMLVLRLCGVEAV